jgi:hypothetical protein
VKIIQYICKEEISFTKTNVPLSSFYILYNFLLMVTFWLKNVANFKNGYCLYNKNIVVLTELFFDILRYNTSRLLKNMFELFYVYRRTDGRRDINYRLVGLQKRLKWDYKENSTKVLNVHLFGRVFDLANSYINVEQTPC